MAAYLIACPFAFLAALIDSVAGGGGLILIPALYLTGMPPHTALGTNKFVSTCFLTVSTGRFLKSGKFHMPTAWVGIVCSLLGSLLGVNLVLVLSERVVQIMLMVLLPLMALFLLTRGKLEDDDEGREMLPLRKAIAMTAASGFVVGCYDGFFGPGSGTFLILALVFLVKFDLRTAMGNAKLINFGSNLGAILMFGANGKVDWKLGIAAAVFGMAGAYIGSGMAIKGGSKVFKPVLAVVMVLLLVKIVGDFVSGLM